MNILHDLFAVLLMIPSWVWISLAVAAKAITAFFMLWVFFLAVMHLQWADKTGRLARCAPIVQKMARVVLLLGQLQNLTLRWSFSILLFWDFELVKEWGISPQVERLANGPDGWQKERAIWWRDNVLKPFDEYGGHD